MSGKYEVPGGRLLRQWLDDRQVIASELAELLEVKTETARNWLYGYCRPRADDREAIEVLTGICSREWLTPTESVRRANKLERLRKLARTKKVPNDIFTRLAPRC